MSMNNALLSGSDLPDEVGAREGANSPRSDVAIQFGPFSFDAAQSHLRRDGVRVHLVPKAAAVLRCLLSRPGDTIAKDEFLDGVWSGRHVTDECLTQAISVIRHALGDSHRNPTYVQTVHGEGYRFIASVLQGPPDEVSGTSERSRGILRPGEGAKTRGELSAAPRPEPEPTTTNHTRPGTRSFGPEAASLKVVVLLALVLAVMALALASYLVYFVRTAHGEAPREQAVVFAATAEAEQREEFVVLDADLRPAKRKC